MFKIKTLEKETVPFVCEIMCEPNNISALHTNTISLEEWKSIFERAEYDADEENFIVYQNDTPCCWLKINGLQNKYTAWISMLVVSERFKHQGVGKFAVEFAIGYLAIRGYQHIKLHTTEDNLPAIRLYEKSGFRLIENKEDKLTFSITLNNLTFINITKENISNYKKLRKTYAKYKIKSLRNQGEMPGNKKMFYELFDSIISNSSFSNSDYFIVMKTEKELIGFASISTSSTDVVDIPYPYGKVKDFYISPKHRRKGYGRILNHHIEKVFDENGTNTVLLSPDPISGIDFWKAMGYCDTGIYQGWGRHFVYIKHIKVNSLEIDNAISELVTSTDLIGINPYNKPQIKEVYGVWKEYCKEIHRKPRRKDIKNMAWNARKNRNVSFKAMYYQGKIIGFTYKSDTEINYNLSEYLKKESETNDI